VYKVVILIFLYFIGLINYGQEITLHVIFSPATFEFNSYKKTHPNEKSLQKELQKIYSMLLSEGYLACSIDSIYKSDQGITAMIFTGNKYYYGKIKKGNVDEEALQYAGYKEKIFKAKILNNQQIQLLCERILKFYEDRGYPFVSVKLDSMVFQENRLSAKLLLEKNKLFKVDSIIIKGNAQISKSYLYNYIKIKPGDLYNETLLREVSSRLNEIPFIQVLRQPEIVFTDNDCRLMLYIDKKRAGNINGVAGILPDNRTGKIVISGDARLNLKNIFGKGEQIDLNWRRLNNNVQDLKTGFAYPFLFNTSFGTDLGLKLFKKDTTFLEITRMAAVQYYLKGGSYFKVFGSFYNSNLLTPKMFANATVLPAFADVSTSLYGIGIKHERLDYRINPRKGFNVLMDVSAGYKKITKNPALNEMLYDNVKLKSIQYHIQSFSELYIPLFKRQTIRLANQTAIIYNENLFNNELMRIGGFRTLRGFDEESIFASLYSITTAEYRFLLDKNSVFYLFFDQAYYERKLKDNNFADAPLGFGIGVNFETKAGIFTLNYALGKQQNNPVLIRAAKIHFGFSAFL
jgi:outer membrane protein assembly factor BamA